MAAIQCPGCGLPVAARDGSTCPRCGARLIVTALTLPDPPPSAPVPEPWNREATLRDPVPDASRVSAGTDLSYTSSGLAYEPTAVPAPGMAARPDGATPVLLPRYGPPSQPDATDASVAVPAGAPASAKGARKSGMRAGVGGTNSPARTLRVVGVLVALFVLILAAVAGRAALGARATPHGQGVSTATPMVSPTATVPPLSYFAPLDTPVSGWPVGGSAFFRADGYHLTGGAVAPAPVQTLTTFDVSVQMRQLKGSTSAACGLVFAMTSSQDFYAFLVAANGTYEVFDIAGRSRTVLTGPTPSAAIARGLRATNVLEVRGTIDLLTFLVNGQMVGQTTYSPTGPGGVGLAGASKVEVVFANFALTGAP